MSRVTISLCFVFLSFFSIQAQNHNTKVPENSTLSFRDWAIVNRNNVYQIEYRKNNSPEVPFELYTGHFFYQDSNGTTVHIQLEDNIAVGDWQYFIITEIGPVYSSTLSFVDGYKHGQETKFYYDLESTKFSNFVKSWTMYTMGKKTQKRCYWENGQVSKVEYYDDNECSHREHIAYLKNGNIQYKGQYKHGRKYGVWEYFYEDATLRKQVKHKGGKRNPIVLEKSYYPNGELKNVLYTKNNLTQESYLLLDTEGDTLHYHRFKKGVPYGKQIYVQTKAKKQAEVVRTTFYLNRKGIHRGSYTQHFLENKQLRVEGNYNRKGERNGLWKYYLYDGRSYLKETYKNGVLVSQKKLLSDQELEQEGLHPEHHLEEFPSGKLVREKKEPKLFLFSE